MCCEEFVALTIGDFVFWSLFRLLSIVAFLTLSLRDEVDVFSVGLINTIESFKLFFDVESGDKDKLFSLSVFSLFESISM